MSDLGAGQQTPFDPNSDLSTIQFIVRQMLERMDTMKLVKVVAVTGGGGAIAKAGTVDVQPLVSQIDGSGNAIEHGTIHKIPWWRVQGGTGGIISDPKVGDVGYVIVADRDSSSVKGADLVTPGSRRTHDIADGVYVGALFSEAPEQYIAFSDDGMTITDKFGNKIEMTSTGVKITPVAAGVTIMGNLTLTGNLQLGGDILGQAGGTYSGDFKVGGNVIAGFGTGASVGLKTHTHTQGADSHGDSQQATAAPTGGT